MTLIMTLKVRFEFRILRLLRILCQNLATQEACPGLSYLPSPYLAVCHLRISAAFRQDRSAYSPWPYTHTPS